MSVLLASVSEALRSREVEFMANVLLEYQIPICAPRKKKSTERVKRTSGRRYYHVPCWWDQGVTEQLHTGGVPRAFSGSDMKPLEVGRPYILTPLVPELCGK